MKMILENEIFEEKDLLSGNCLMKCLKFLKIIDVIMVVKIAIQVVKSYVFTI